MSLLADNSDAALITNDDNLEDLLQLEKPEKPMVGSKRKRGSSNLSSKTQQHPIDPKVPLSSSVSNIPVYVTNLCGDNNIDIHHLPLSSAINEGEFRVSAFSSIIPSYLLPSDHSSSNDGSSETISLCTNDEQTEVVKNVPTKKSKASSSLTSPFPPKKLSSEELSDITYRIACNFVFAINSNEIKVLRHFLRHYCSAFVKVSVFIYSLTPTGATSASNLFGTWNEVEFSPDEFIAYLSHHKQLAPDSTMQITPATHRLCCEKASETVSISMIRWFGHIATSTESSKAASMSTPSAPQKHVYSDTDSVSIYDGEPSDRFKTGQPKVRRYFVSPIHMTAHDKALEGQHADSVAIKHYMAMGSLAIHRAARAGRIHQLSLFYEYIQ